MLETLLQYLALKYPQSILNTLYDYVLYIESFA